MNMSNSPSIGQLVDAYASCDDSFCDHRVVVFRDGDVYVGPDDGVNHLSERVQFYGETLTQGAGYVGENASKDEEYMLSEFSWLVEAWNSGYRGLKVYRDSIHLTLPCPAGR